MNNRLYFIITFLCLSAANTYVSSMGLISKIEIIKAPLIHCNQGNYTKTIYEAELTDFSKLKIIFENEPQKAYGFVTHLFSYKERFMEEIQALNPDDALICLVFFNKYKSKTRNH